MNRSINLKRVLGCIMLFLFCSMAAQEIEPDGHNNLSIYKADKRADHYQKLLKLGYKENEIFEDLGNTNFLVENYEEAVYWYHKLIDLDLGSTHGTRYYERYLFALKKVGARLENNSDEKDWLAHIQLDYLVGQNPVDTKKLHNYRELNVQENQIPLASHNRSFETLDLEGNLSFPNNEREKREFPHEAPIAITADGNTAYFSKAIYTKPLYGLFSKKELVHKIYKARKIKGKWKNIEEVALTPKHYSAIHPAISHDGKRLFFASDMPGTFGKYDIYVADIKSDGSFGVAKNLGPKVNTDNNDLYPSTVGRSSLFFASNGRKGLGGLDVFMVEVDHKKISSSVHLGSPVNSAEDDFSIVLMANKNMGYVMSNRGDSKKNPQRIAFSYSKDKTKKLADKREINILETLESDVQIDYSTSVFEE